MGRQLGLVVNPVAGIGGPAGLKGSDGVAVQREARERGGQSRATERAIAALRAVAGGFPDTASAVVLTAAGTMGEDAVRAAGLTPVVVAVPSGGGTAADRTPADSTAADTTGADTTEAVRAIVGAGADLVLFAGGDGTARDVCAALDGRADRPVAVLGIPAGVKMYSSCFAVSPSAAGGMAARWAGGSSMQLVESEVLDVDEQQMRRERVEPGLFGLALIPDEPGRTQARKSPSPQSQTATVRSAARGVVAGMRPGVRYLLGPGSTVGRVADALGVPNTPLGVDVVLDGRLELADASEAQLLALIARGPAQAVVTVIGGQGFLLGRGNQQISARVVDALGDDPLVVVATEQKLIELKGRPLLVDTGDTRVDARLAGYVRVITGAATGTIYPVIAPENHEGEGQ